eukprot:12254283-Heterocapsa_arctica.AAC.2
MVSACWLSLNALASSSAPLFFPSGFSSCAGPNRRGGAFAFGLVSPNPSALWGVGRCPGVPGDAPCGVSGAAFPGGPVGVPGPFGGSFPPPPPCPWMTSAIAFW